MKKYTSYHPTEFIFGEGALENLTEVVGRFGKKVLLVRTPVIPATAEIYAQVEMLINASGAELYCFDEVEPNPTTEVISNASKIAIDANIDLVVALGGGSSIDTAKCVAIEAAYKLPCWDFRFGSGVKPGPETLPIIAIPTTSGTGSEATPVAVVSNEVENYKSIIWSTHIFCKCAIIDPTLTYSMPRGLTAATGFDAFAHCFESYISSEATPMASLYALEGMRLVANSLLKAVEEPTNAAARAEMMVAGTLGGMSIAETGVTLPHGMGMAIGGFCHKVSHGASMAIVYPEIIARSAAEGGEKYARVARLFDPSLGEGAEYQLASIIDKLLEKIGLRVKLSDFDISASEIPGIAKASVEQPGWQVHPRIHTEEEMYDILLNCY